MYSYVSTVHLGKVPLSKIVSFLVSHRISHFQFFTPLRLSLPHGIQLLFHNTSPYKLQEILARTDHNGSKPVFLMIDNGIRLGRRLSLKELEELWTVLQKLKMGEEVNYYEYR